MTPATYAFHLHLVPRWRRILRAPRCGFNVWRTSGREIGLLQCLTIALVIASARYGDERR